MSGIIHINGKNYDAEGNLIKPTPQMTKFLDGVAPIKQNPATTRPLKALTPVKSSKIEPAHNRVDLKPPTDKIKKSSTLNRLAVKKPTAKPELLSSSSLNQILKNKRPTVQINNHVVKHSNVIRAAQAPILNVSEPQKHNSNVSSAYIPKRKTEEMIQAQLESATAHLMTFKKPNVTHHIKKKVNSLSKMHRRFVLSSAMASLSLVVIGVAIFANLPGISISIASRKAGFGALMPSFTPNGYKVKTPIGYTPGKVVINFNSNTNDLKYSIEQKPTGWTSETLREQVTSSNGSQYQTQYANGLTIFFTGEDTATWVDRGILFVFQGNSGLSIDQIANIAASM